MYLNEITFKGTWEDPKLCHSSISFLVVRSQTILFRAQKGLKKVFIVFYFFFVCFHYCLFCRLTGLLSPILFRNLSKEKLQFLTDYWAKPIISTKKKGPKSILVLYLHTHQEIQ
jgi:hypothetical protein